MLGSFRSVLIDMLGKVHSLKYFYMERCSMENKDLVGSGLLISWKRQ